MWIVEIILNLSFFRSDGKGPSARAVAVVATIVFAGTVIAIITQSTIG